MDCVLIDVPVGIPNAMELMGSFKTIAVCVLIALVLSFSPQAFSAATTIAELPIAESSLSPEIDFAELNNTLLALAVLILLLLISVGAMNYRRVLADRLMRQQKEHAETLEETLRLRTKELEQQVLERMESEEAKQILESRVVEDDKMRALGQLTGGIAHDYNNLLTVIQSSAEMITLNANDNPDLARHAASIQTAVESCISINRGLLSFARQQPLAPEVIELNQFFEDSRTMFQQTLGARMTLHVSCMNDLYVKADAAQLLTALINLLTNARDASDEIGPVQLLATADSDEFVSLVVSDHGHGMTAEQISHAHEPFYSTKNTPLASGLGLSMVYGFAYQSGGQISIQSDSQIGTVVSLQLPRSVSTPLPTAQDRPMENFPDALSALVVDDHVEVAEMVCEMLTSIGIHTSVAHSGDEGLDKWRDLHPDIVVTDVQMPGKTNGIQLADEIKRERPETSVLLISGFADVPKIDYPLLAKPFTRNDLRKRLVDIVANNGQERIEH